MKLVSFSNLLLIQFIIFITVRAADYYKTLEISKDATDDEIKKAFRRLSIKYHPDKNPGDQVSAQKFLDVNKAHEVLINRETRQIYDLYGEEGLQRGNHPWQNNNMPRGPNTRADIWVTLEELYNGADREMQIRRNILCSQCRGTGAKDGKTHQCTSCGGKGVRLQQIQVGLGFNMQMQVTCEKCGGRGHTNAANCPHCKGNKVIPDTKTVEIEIERGMPDGKEIIFEKESEQGPDFIPGDVIFVIRTQGHKLFTRVGDNLYTTLPIDLKDSLLGFKKRIKHLHGYYTVIESNEVVQPNQIQIIHEEGMPVHSEPSSYGDLHVKFELKLPKVLSDKDKEILAKIFNS